MFQASSIFTVTAQFAFAFTGVFTV